MAEKAPIKLDTILKMSDKNLVEMLWKSGHLDKMSTCVHCGVGILGPLLRRPQTTRWARRCPASLFNMFVCDGRALPQTMLLVVGLRLVSRRLPHRLHAM